MEIDWIMTEERGKYGDEDILWEVALSDEHKRVVERTGIALICNERQIGCVFLYQAANGSEIVNMAPASSGRLVASTLPS
jgi:hypothetical protein